MTSTVLFVTYSPETLFTAAITRVSIGCWSDKSVVAICEKKKKGNFVGHRIYDIGEHAHHMAARYGRKISTIYNSEVRTQSV